MRGHDWINTLLPDELLIEIFRRLDSKSSRDAGSLVYTRWLRLERFTRAAISSPRGRRRASGNSSVKLHYVNDKHGSASDQSDLDSLCISDSGLTALAEGFPKLEKLRLIFCSNVTSEGLSSLARKCTSLKSLDMQAFGCYVGDQGLAAVGQCCKQLEDLNLRFCEGLNDIGLVELALGVGNALKSLGVAACAKITDVSMEGLEEIATGCKELTHLEVNGCHNIGALGQESVGKSCQHLSELALLYCQRIGDAGLLQVGQGCKFLQALHLVDCSNIGNEAMCGIAIGCRNLKKLYIRRCYKIMLESCHMVYCYGRTSVGVTTVVSSCPNIKKFLLRSGRLANLQSVKQAQSSPTCV
ncbi:hypothetical protein JHK82_041892 [Glycine max]|nr:hypothetical protein JHK82_041892 [Glycine max]KAG5116048.1 hypothetical protein JHK84_042161 [Glycine max]